MTRLHHVNVVVPPGRTDDVVPFYTDVIGLRRVPKPAEGVAPEGAWFDIGDGTQLHVSERPGVPHPDVHFGVEVAEFAALLARLAGCGAPWTEQPDLFGGRRGFTRDPCGNRVELLAQPGSPAG